MLKPLAALCLLVAPALAQQPPPDPTSALQSAIAQSVAQDHFTGAVLVVHNGAILVDQGYGAADLEWKIPNSPAARFRLGSLTKQFTAASFLLLEERGKLSLEDHVSKYMPDAPPAWAAITLKNLLNHTSGIPNFTGFPDYRASESRDTTPAELVLRFRDKPLSFPPGSKFSYSNSGYVLLGYLLERITADTYAHFLQTNIFTPLHMDSTGLDSNAAILPNRAQGYTFGPRGFEHAGYISMTIPFSAGALFSTTGDLLKWENALFYGSLLTPASLKKLTTPALEQYGLGVIMTDSAGHPLVTHNGGIEGFTTYLTQYPQDHLTVVVLANSDSFAPDALGRNLGRIALGQPVIPPVPTRAQVPVAAATLATYQGNYRLLPGLLLTVTLNGTQLSAQGTGQQSFALYPESQTKFFSKVVDAQILFNLDPTGKPLSLTLFQDGHVLTAPRE